MPDEATRYQRRLVLERLTGKRVAVLPMPERYHTELRAIDQFPPGEPILARVMVDIPQSPWLVVAWAGRYRYHGHMLHPYFTLAHRFEVVGIEE